MKQTLVFLLFFVSAVGLLSSCSKSKNTSTDTSSTVSAAGSTIGTSEDIIGTYYQYAWTLYSNTKLYYDIEINSNNTFKITQFYFPHSDWSDGVYQIDQGTYTYLDSNHIKLNYTDTTCRTQDNIEELIIWKGSYATLRFQVPSFGLAYEQIYSYVPHSVWNYYSGTAVLDTECSISFTRYNNWYY